MRESVQQHETAEVAKQTDEVIVLFPRSPSPVFLHDDSADDCAIHHGEGLVPDFPQHFIVKIRDWQRIWAALFDVGFVVGEVSCVIGSKLSPSCVH